MHSARDGARQVIRSQKSEFKHARGQPMPKLRDWVEVLTEIIEKEAKLPKRLDPAVFRGTVVARI
jgi:hypothetical protein